MGKGCVQKCMLSYALDLGDDVGADLGQKAVAGVTFPKTVLALRLFAFFALAAHR